MEKARKLHQLCLAPTKFPTIVSIGARVGALPVAEM